MTVTAGPRELQLVAQIERRHRQPDLCTIYEPDADGLSRQTTWITAKEGSFVALDAVR
jgi:hypothetical protein